MKPDENVTITTVAKPDSNTSWWANLSFVPNTKSAGKPMLKVESGLELIEALKQLMDPEYKYVTTGIRSKDDPGIENRYTEDINYSKDGKVLHHLEVKNSKALEDAKISKKLKDVEKVFTTETSTFEVKDENEIAPGLLAKNIIRLYRYYHLEFDEKSVSAVLKLASQTCPIELLSLIDATRNKNIKYGGQIVWHLLSHKKLIVDDLSEFIWEDTIVKVAENVCP